MSALEPHISKETIEYHYGKHHRAYVVKLNELIDGTDLARKTLEKIIFTAEGPIFNNAAQVWNHTFYWQCLSPKGGGDPDGIVADKIISCFGSVAAFKELFNNAATTLFGSGWVWLVKKPGGTLAIEQTSNAATPLTGKDKPLLTCDVWEHAYYIDYRNARPKYVESFWNLVNWDHLKENL